MLAHPCNEAPTASTTDALGEAVGAVLLQLVHGVSQPLAYFGKHLCPAEMNVQCLR